MILTKRRQLARVAGTISFAISACSTAIAQQATPVPDISVTETATLGASHDAMPPNQRATSENSNVAPQNKLDGSAASGYRVENATTTGPWGSLPLQDTPYSVNVMSQQLIENVQASSPDQLFRMNPLVQLQQPTSLNGAAKINIRGFNVRTSMEDGLRNPNGWGNALEQYDRVEILSGLSGFLYGPANVGGMVNYVTKTPTTTPLANITAGDHGGSNFFVHGDFGGPLDNGMFGYRLNFLTENGDEGPQYSTLSRNLISGAVDWHITDRLTLELNGSYFDYKQFGVPAAWTTAKAFRYPSAPSVDRLWSEPWTYQTVGTGKIGGNLKWDLNEIFSLRASYRHVDYTDQNITNTDNLQINGTYSQVSTVRALRGLGTDAGNAFLDAHFDTGFIDHKVTVGVFGDRYAWLQHPDEQANINVKGVFSPTFPIYAVQPAYNIGLLPTYKNIAISDRNIMIGDDVKITDQWSALLGVNYARVGETDWSTSKGLAPASARYDKGAWTPNFSLLFKPVPWLTAYGTYIQSLEEGPIVPNTGALIYTNAGQILQPIVSTQYEIGAKATVGEVFLTAALFQIEKANDYSKNNGNGTYTYFQDGKETHKGVELTATGTIVPGVRVVGGLTFFDAMVTQSSDWTLNNRKPGNVAEKMIKTYAEYDLPFVPGLTLTAGGYYTGAFYADALNSQVLPGVLIGDIGARYTTTVFSQNVTARLNVTNVANKSYWLNANYLGDPRRVAFSLEARF
jgi:iron complex outermembrane recepter protein